MSGIVGEIVEPYAAALMSVAGSHDLTEDFGHQMRSLVSLLDESGDLREFLSNPVINRNDKKAVLNRVVGDEVNPYLRNFLMLLVDRGRILFLEEIGKQYLALLRELNQTVLAEVTSAVELNDDQKRVVVEKVKSLTGARNVELETKINSDLLGGVIIQVGSQVFDASLRGQLRRIGVSLSAS
ncbi:MAG: ATP synthase F1 subunit delta [Limnospira sp.]